jgi:hypothetical protein
MTDTQTNALALKDAAGNYFLVAQETLEQGRVPAERKAEVERLIAAAQGGAGGDDAEGYILPLIFAGFVAYSVGVVGGFAVTRSIIRK